MSSPVAKRYPMNEGSGTYTIFQKQKAAGARLCVGLLVDISKSTKDVRGDIQTMLCDTVQQMQGTLLLQNMVRLIVVCFNHTTHVLVNEDLEAVTKEMLRLPEPNGATDTGGAILYMLQLMDKQKQKWKEEEKVAYLQPLLFLFTDGYPYAGTIPGEPQEQLEARQRKIAANYQAAAKEIKNREGKKLTFVAGGFQSEDGESADMDKLRELTGQPEGTVFRLINAGTAAGSDTLTLESFFSKLRTMTNNTARNEQPVETPADDVYDEVMK